MLEPNNLYVGTQSNPDDRLKLRVSHEDMMAVGATRGAANRRVTVTDLNTGRRYLLRRASCGLPRCICALELIREVRESVAKATQDGAQ